MAPNRTSSERRAALIEKREAQILRVARRIFAKYGYRRTPIEKVAAALTVGKGTVYRYFGSKKKLFIAVANQAMQEMGQATARPARAEAGLLKKIAAAIRGQLEFVDDNPDVVEILLQERTEFRAEFKPTYLVYRDANLGHLENVLREGMSRGLIRSMNVTVAANMLCDLVYGIIMVGYMRQDRRLRETAEDAVETLFRGLLTPAGQDAWRSEAGGPGPPPPRGEALPPARAEVRRR
jgi:AcrR family transcriptional regulator